MISCTEFIPSYSELFSYLEDKHGRQEVDRFWEYLFVPDGKGIPLIDFVKKEGVRGCFTYWSGTLNEEAADFTMYLNEKRGFFLNVMHKCPSKGRLLELEKTIGIKPYHDYCLHCDHYRAAAEKVGLKYIYNFQGIEKAACSMLIYDPNVFDGRVIIDEDTEIMDRRASDNEYFHKAFHSSVNRGIHYLGEKYGQAYVTEYLTRYTNNVYHEALADIRSRGLAAIEDFIRASYEKEKAPEVMHAVQNGNSLEITIDYCPAVSFLKSIGRTVSPWYRQTTEVVMQVLAQTAGVSFTMESYDEESGAARYRFA